MKYLKSYKIFEEAVLRPIKKLPTDKAIHYSHLREFLKSKNIDTSLFHDFCYEKCSKDQIVFPNMVDSKGWSKDGQSDARYENFIFGESVFLLPMSYDSSKDKEIFDNKKKDFFSNMKNIMGFKTKEEEDKFKKSCDKHVSFGQDNWSLMNPILDTIHNKYKEYYKNGKLRIWMPKDTDYDGYEGYDFPHKYDVVNNLSRPDGVYYLSDVEKYIDDKYGIKDELLYEFIISNMYIEGRYWERVWSFKIEDKKSKNLGKSKLMKSGFGKYGMEPTENILHILNILEKDFGDEIEGTDYEGFPIYIDYFKKIDPKH